MLLSIKEMEVRKLPFAETWEPNGFDFSDPGVVQKSPLVAEGVAELLPDTGGEGAYAVGERIRERIAAFKFLVGDGLDIHLTASLGVATLPDAAASVEELVQAADMAMYHVKESGKNGIHVAPAAADN